MPKEFTEKYGSNHIGGIDCANGYIYAPVEGKVDGKHLYNFILLYDCKTLKYTGIYYDMSSEYLTDGIPWCAIDRENGYLYTSQFHNVGEILQYDLETMTFLRAIPLEEKLDRIQGVSLGLMYEPGLYADTEELKKVVKLCCKYNKPLTVHPRAESKVSMSYDSLFGRSHLLRAEDELVEISKGTNLKLQHSHAIFVGRQSFGDKDEFVAIQNSLRENGVDAMFDIYNETLGVSVITVVLPVWYQGMSKEERKKPLNKLKLSVLIKATSILLGFGFKDIQIAYIGPGYEKYEGKTVHEIAKENGKSDLDMYLQLCEESDFKGRVNMGPYSTPEIIREFEHNPNCLYMTDAWVEDFGVQNPAIYDCYPKFLRDSLRGTGDTLPNTVRRMTGATADRFMLKDRGYVKPGYFADFTVFDEDETKNATPDQTKSFGIKKVFINGELVLDNDELNKSALKTTGRALTV